MFLARGTLLPIPKALGDIFNTGGACTLLCSDLATREITEPTSSSSKPYLTISSLEQFSTI